MPKRTDDTTALVWQMIANAAKSPMTREDVIEQLSIALQRNVNYLSYRERRGRRTATDEALESDMAAMARAIHLLQNDSGTSSDLGA